MSVEAAQAGVRQAEMKLVEAKFLLEKEALVADSPDANLAGVIRDAYYDDGVLRLLVDSGDPGQWLRMAKAAREFLAPELEPTPREPRVFHPGQPIPADVTEVFSKAHDLSAVRCRDGGWWWIEKEFDRKEAAGRGGWSEVVFDGYPLVEVIENTPVKRVPRVFKVGDDEPADRDTIVLRRQEAGGRRLELRYGKYGVRAASELTEWWQVAQDHRTFGKWDYWLAHFGPLVEVVDGEDVREPRVFSYGDAEPADLTGFEDSEGDRYVRDGDEWFTETGGITEDFSFIVKTYGPLTEVFE